MSQVARHLGSNPFSGPERPDYVMTDVLVPVVRGLSVQSGPAAYARLHLVVLVVLWAVVAVARAGSATAAPGTWSLLLAVSPLVTVSMQWLVSPTRSPPPSDPDGPAAARWAVLVVAVLAGLTHPEQAVFAAAVAAVVRAVLVDDVAVADAAAPASGSSLGRGGVRSGSTWRPRSAGCSSAAWSPRSASVAGIELGRPARRISTSASDASSSTTSSNRSGCCDPVDPQAGRGRRDLRALRRGVDPGSARRWAVLATAVVTGAGAVLVTLDETRVYAVITAPLLVGVAVLLDRASAAAGSARRRVRRRPAGPVAGGSRRFATRVTSWRGQLDTPAMVEFLSDGTRPPGDLTRGCCRRSTSPSRLWGAGS